jgi:hypothetical protein
MARRRSRYSLARSRADCHSPGVTETTPKPRPKKKQCPRCGGTFQCAEDLGPGSCWCEALPKVSSLPGAGNECLCPICLPAAIAAAQKAR